MGARTLTISISLSMVSCLAAQSAQAWYKHEVLIPWIVRGLAPNLRKSLQREFPAPCPEQDEALVDRLKKELVLNPKAKIASTAVEQCRAKASVSFESILLSGFTDDPDAGLDTDLDLSPDQVYLGGKTGPSSQGYRHVYLDGWSWMHPVSTFQVPAHAMGDAHERASLLAQKARALIAAGELAWGARVMAWALHYVQDLSQPFHAVQTPSWKMIPWLDPGYLEKSVTNYHWAYEGFILERFKDKAIANEMADCMLNGSALTQVRFDEHAAGPRELALETARASRALASRLGAAEVALFGSELKTRNCSLPEGKCMPDFDKILTDPGLRGKRQALEKVSCLALANASFSSRRLIEWILR